MSNQAETATHEPPKNWIDDLVNERLLPLFESLGEPGIWSPKARAEIAQLIALQKARHYPAEKYSEAQLKLWSMLAFHFGQFKAMEDGHEVPF